MKKEMIKIGVIGAAGRMGQALIRCIKGFPSLQLVGAVDCDQCPDIGTDAGIVAGAGKTGVLISCDAREITGRCDVLVDFSFAAASVRHAEIAAENRKGIVIGTTGLDQDQTASLAGAATKSPVVWAPNMSMGMNLLFNMVEKASGILRDYDIEIIETHHRHKKDAPSGSALRLAEAAAAGRNTDTKSVAIYGRKGQIDERPASQIGVHAVRAGDVVGDHIVIFGDDGERLELVHRASNRDCFAVGALRAAEWVVGRKPGMYNMQDVLDISG